METRLDTVMFTDLVGSVRMYTRVSDTVAAGLVTLLEHEIKEILPRHQGRFIKSTGDGQLLTFEASPAAARCAKEIHHLCDLLAHAQGQDISVRIALHTGEVLHQEGDVLGSTVNLAARLLTVTGNSETSVTAEAWKPIPKDDRYGFIEHGPEVFKGFKKYCFVYKKPNPNPATDVTVLQPAGGEDLSIHSTAGMSPHPEYALFLDHPDVKKTIRVKEGETHLMGRSPECATVIPDRMFSTTHAAFGVVNGVLWVFDLQSSNGIRLFGRRIPRRKPLGINSVLELPTGTLTVKLPSSGLKP